MPFDAATFPRLGLGLSTNLNAREHPNPYRLLEAKPGLFDFVEYSAPLDLKQARAEASLFPELWQRRETTPVLFHPVHLNLYGPTLESAESLAALDAHARAVGSAWVGNDVGWWHEGGAPFPGYLYVAPPFTPEGVEECVTHAEHVQRHLSVPLLLENPAVLRKVGELHVLDFMRALHERTGRGLLIDVGHLWSYQLAAGLELTAQLERLPGEAVVEIHIAGGVVTERGGRRFYVDDHTQPVREELFELLAALLPRCPNLKALTFEGEGHPEALALKTLERLREMWPASRQRAPGAPPANVSGQLPALNEAPEPRTARKLFGELHDAEPPQAEDPDGLRAERDFRRAVLAEQLDQAFPLSRPLLAPDVAGLDAFTSSEDFLGIFEGRGLSLTAAFARWTRRRVRQTPRLAVAIAFEMWAQELARQPDAHQPPPLPEGLTPGARVAFGTFAQDLSEALFAAQALRRHLGQRAWGTQVLEPSGWSSLAQAVTRAGPGPWNLAARWRGPKLELASLPGPHAVPAEWEALLAGGWLRRKNAGAVD